MTPVRLAFLAHIAVAIAAVLIAFFVWPTRNWVLAWTLPAVTFVIGFFILLAAEWAAGAT